jgi:hypothetical protein
MHSLETFGLKMFEDGQINADDRAIIVSSYPKINLYGLFTEQQFDFLSYSLQWIVIMIRNKHWTTIAVL